MWGSWWWENGGEGCDRFGKTVNFNEKTSPCYDNMKHELWLKGNILGGSKR